jgi:hypothetical protein
MTEMQSARKGKTIPNRLDNIAMNRQMDNTKKTFPLRGHCWRAALLAVFRLIVVVGFVSGCKLGILANWLPEACIAVCELGFRDRDRKTSSLSAQRAYVANAWISR